MPHAFILYGPIETGKTRTCLYLLERAREAGVEASGVLSPRVFSEGKLQGYDCLNAATSERFPLVRLSVNVEGPGWFQHAGLMFSFSVPGFKHANEILLDSAGKMERSTLAFVDEFGRIERAGRGLYEGVKQICDALPNGGVVVITCRGDLIEAAEEMIRGSVNVIKVEPGNLENMWELIWSALAEDLK
ncbi:MAG TPA: nucleoside-triphosphatase [Patescibacteria group bacterium]|nr:nucleoside-triphosphatase [Patescibacteria group bacterium]